MMDMKNIKYITIILLAALATSCDNFLTENPPYNVTVDNAIRNYDDAQAAIIGMYSSLNLGSRTSTSDFFGGRLYCTLASQAGTTKAVGGIAHYNMTYNSTTASFGVFWQNWYACINAANLTIMGIEKLDVSKFPSAVEKERMLAEAKCFRAWVNAHILWCFGHFWKDDEYGILYRTEMANMTNIYIDRLSVRESYEKIFDDLKDVDLLDDYSSSKYLSKQMGQALKAKILLNRGWEGDYAEALQLVETILATAPADFKMDPDMKNMYNDAWDSKEVLWARYLESSGTARAYGEGSYSLSLIASGDSNKNDPSSLLSFYSVFDSWLTDDNRFDVTMGWARYLSATGVEYFCPTKLARGGRANMNDKFTTYYFRYPELLLMQAELRARTGKTIAESIEPINTMRGNRTNPILPQIPVPANKEDLMYIIFKEYCLELYTENGSEWFASLRFQRDNDTWLQILKPDVLNIPETNFCWPIPSVETSVNHNIKPNPGYDN